MPAVRPNEVFMFSTCTKCDQYYETEVQENIVDLTVKVKWIQRTNVNGRSEKREFEGDVVACAQHFSTLVQNFLSHLFIKRAQSGLFERSEGNNDDRRIVLQFDYAEKFALDQ